MDDITFGVSSIKEASEILSDTSEVLKSRGLALNISKTKIYDPSLAEFHFQIKQNQYLDSIKGKNNKEIKKEVQRKFREHLKDTSPKSWDKITKRYITKFAEIKSKFLLRDAIKIYNEFPDIRSNVIYYLKSMGYSIETSKMVIELLKTHNRYDDISLYNISMLLTEWKIKRNEETKAFLLEVESLLSNHKSNMDFYSLMIFKAKYNHPEDLLNFIKKFSNKWHKEALLRRQIVCILSRLYLYDKEKVNNLLNQQISSGVIDTISVANMILSFLNLDKLDSKLSSYLFPPQMKRDYSLSRYLVLCSVLNSEQIRVTQEVRNKIKKFIVDPFYLHWLDVTYNINIA